MYQTKSFRGAVTKIALLLIVVPCVRGEVLYVDNDASGLCNGSSWANAFRTVQDALAAAHAMSKPVEIRVAQGLYRPDQGTAQAPGDVEATFRLINGVTLRGGYAGLGRWNPDTRDVAAYKTVLSGDLNGDDATIIDPCEPWRDFSTNTRDNCETVVLAAAVDRTAVLDGFVVASGRGDRFSPLESGGGISCIDASPTITHCTITRNGDASRGSGISNVRGNPTIRDCTFLHNGLGMYNTIGSPVLENCTFSHHRFHHEAGYEDDTGRSVFRGCTFADGSGLRISDSSTAMEDCTFERNETAVRSYDSSLKAVGCVFRGNSGDRGAAIHGENSELDISDCEFARNVADGAGGAIRMVASSADIRRSVFTDNVAGSGGAICTYYHSEWVTGDDGNRVLVYEGSKLAMADCNFTENEAQGSGGGAIYLNGDDRSCLTNCLFERNSARWGDGALEFVSGTVTLSRCRLVDNSVAGISSRSSEVTASKCVFKDNRWWGIKSDWGSCSLHGCEFLGNRRRAVVSYGGSVRLTNCVLAGNGEGAISCHDTEMSLVNCTVCSNVTDFSGGGIWYGHSCPPEGCDDQAHPRIVNSIFWNNWPDQIHVTEEIPSVTYSNIQGGWPGDGNVDVDPLFISPGCWDPNGTPDDPNDDFFVDGDYHLKSQAGRWDPAPGGWALDDITSPCVDAGDPEDPVAFEPSRNGTVVNLGAYGGTDEASKSTSGIDARYGGGTGEPNDPFLVYTPQHINTLGTEPNDWGDHFRLMAHIDLSVLADGQFNIIGYEWRDPFTGVFDGNGHTIANLACVSNQWRSVGFFGYVSGAEATIMNVGLIDPRVHGVNKFHSGGSLVGILDDGTVMNCYVTGGYVIGDSDVGGLVGKNGGTIECCFATCSVIASTTVGGLVGDNFGGTITNCYSGSTVIGEDHCGGLVGTNRSNAEVITNCYAFGPVVGTGDRPGAGLVNWAASDSFWDIETSGQGEGTGGTGLTTAEMQTASTFLNAGWDFIGESENGTDDIWWINEGQDYPRLWWELTEATMN